MLKSVQNVFRRQSLTAAFLSPFVADSFSSVGGEACASLIAQRPARVCSIFVILIILITILADKLTVCLAIPLALAHVEHRCECIVASPHRAAAAHAASA